MRNSSHCLYATGEFFVVANREKLILISSIGSLVLGIMFASDYLPYAVAIAAVCFVLFEIYRHLPILRKHHDE